MTATPPPYSADELRFEQEMGIDRRKDASESECTVGVSPTETVEDRRVEEAMRHSR